MNKPINTPIGSVLKNPYDTREDYGDIEGIKASIKKYGLLQPLLARKNSEEGYELAFGGRRLQAVRELGYDRVNLDVRDLNDADMSTLVILENVHRKDLNPVELAKAYRRGLDATKLPLSDFSKLIGVRDKTITDYLRILSLPERILRKPEKYNAGQLIALGKLTDLSLSVRTELENELQKSDMNVHLVGQVVNACENVFRTGLPERKKRKVCAEIIAQDYSHLTPVEYGDVRVFADALLSREVTRHTSLLAKYQPSLIKSRPAKSKKIKTINDVINYDRELNALTANLRQSNLYVQRAINNGCYRKASQRAQWKFKRVVNKIVVGLEAIIKDGQES